MFLTKQNITNKKYNKRQKQRKTTKIKENKLSEEVGEILWKVAEDSANYSFNKSHSLAYANLAAWTAYLKFKHPQNFFIALFRMAKYEPAPHEEKKKICQELTHVSEVDKSWLL